MDSSDHIPRKGAKQVIYYEAYSQAWRGKERRRRPLWAALLKKVWDIDALKCPQCGGKMKVISFIAQPSVIRRILKHIDLWEDPRPPPEPMELVCEPCAEYIPWKDDVSGSSGNRRF